MVLRSRRSAPSEVGEDRRDVAVVEVPQPVHHLPRRRLDGPDLDGRVALLQVPAHTEQCARGAEPGHEVGHLGAVAPDLGTRPLVVRPGIGRVGVLIEEYPLGMLEVHGLGHAHRAVGALRTGGLDDLGPPHLEELATLHRHVRGQHHLEAIALDPRHQSEADAGVPRRRLEEDRTGLEQPVLLGLLDHGQGDAVFDRPSRVLALELDEDADVGVGAQRADVDEGGVADEIEDARDPCHGQPVRAVVFRSWRVRRGAQPPATAGRIDTVTPSATLVSSWSR